MGLQSKTNHLLRYHYKSLKPSKFANHRYFSTSAIIYSFQAGTTNMNPAPDIQEIPINKDLNPSSSSSTSPFLTKLPFTERSQLKTKARRVVIKIGSAVITRDLECGVALGHLASIVEQVAEMYKEGREVLIVTSGAVAFGKQKLKQEINSFKNIYDIYNKNNQNGDGDYNNSSHDKYTDTSVVKKKESTLHQNNLGTTNEDNKNLDNYLNKNADSSNGNRIYNNIDSRAFAALGQSGLMALYDAMFAQYGIKTAQVLLTQPDFNDKFCRDNLRSTIQQLLALKICPIINANDAIAPPPKLNSDLIGIISVKDNDVVATHLSVDLKADLLVIMSDVPGIYTTPPSLNTGSYSDFPSHKKGAELMDVFCPSLHWGKVKLGHKSRVGTGGMESKINAATYALNNGCSVIICDGTQPNSLNQIINGKNIGTFFVNTCPSTIKNDNNVSKSVNDKLPYYVEDLADSARKGSRKLTELTSTQRANIIDEIANSLISQQGHIIQCNEKDLERAKLNKLSPQLLNRLKLTTAKLKDLADGLRLISNKLRSDQDIVNRVLERTLIAKNLELLKLTVPIGVLLIIFESRPDSLPQIGALSIATANGLLLKGGKEASHSNECLYNIIKYILERYGCQDAISLINNREDIDSLLKLKNKIDLVIPRGSKQLVSTIQEKSNGIPVLGHSEGICHVYLDRDADLQMSLKIVRDSKCEYPSACNAMETLLLHKDLGRNGTFQQIYHMLNNENVIMHPGPRLIQNLIFIDQISSFFPLSTATSSSNNDLLFKEYGDLQCSVEIVEDIDHAIDHINQYGSSHTDCIVTDNDESAQKFLSKVDSACVFHNASTRFADGYRFGLGAEVGISTSRIHARGPVGMDGLLTTKWIMKGNGNCVSDFTAGSDQKYIHKKLFKTY
ncbi:unnamed protein product [Gordionus sp. m RMFG-2023]